MQQSIKHTHAGDCWQLNHICAEDAGPPRHCKSCIPSDYWFKPQHLLASCAISKLKFWKSVKLFNGWGISFLVLCHIIVAYFKRSLSENVPERLQSYYVCFVISIQWKEVSLNPFSRQLCKFYASNLDAYYTCICLSKMHFMDLVFMPTPIHFTTVLSLTHKLTHYT